MQRTGHTPLATPTPEEVRPSLPPPVPRAQVTSDQREQRKQREIVALQTMRASLQAFKRRPWRMISTRLRRATLASETRRTRWGRCWRATPRTAVGKEECGLEEVGRRKECRVVRQVSHGELRGLLWGGGRADSLLLSAQRRHPPTTPPSSDPSPSLPPPTLFLQRLLHVWQLSGAASPSLSRGPSSESPWLVRVAAGRSLASG